MVDAVVRRMVSRNGNTTKTCAVTIQGHAFLILSTVWYIFPCFYSVVLILVMILRARFVLILSLAWKDPMRGTRVPWLNAMRVGKGTDHGVDLCISSRLRGG